MVTDTFTRAELEGKTVGVLKSLARRRAIDYIGRIEFEGTSLGVYRPLSAARKNEVVAAILAYQEKREQAERAVAKEQVLTDLPKGVTVESDPRVTVKAYNCYGDEDAAVLTLTIARADAEGEEKYPQGHIVISDEDSGERCALPLETLEAVCRIFREARGA
jgi:hypothetical protein